MTFANINGLSIHYKFIEGNKQKTFVLINSLGTDFRIWDAVVAQLLPHGSVLCYDKRGHGLSETAPEGKGMEGYYEEILGLLDFLNIQSCIPVGLSVGGRIAMLLAARHPDRVEKLVLCDTAHIIGTTQNWNERINLVRTIGLAALSNAVMERWFSKEYRETNAVAIKAYQRMIANASVEGYIQCCEAVRDADLTDIAKSIPHKTVCVVGSADLATPPELVESLSKLINGSQFKVIEGSGHIPCIDNSNILSSLILEFVKEESVSLSLFEQGMKTRRSVLGDAHVNEAEANKTDFDADFQEYITNSAWGAIWSRPHLTKRERSLLTIAILTALGLEEELAMHIRATANTGATQQDVKEVLLHVGVYAGVPRTNGAIKIAKKVYKDAQM